MTDLNKGIREIWLYKRHYNELEQDVSEMIWLMFGTAFHDVVDQAEEKDHQIKETRLEERIGNLILSGKFDLYDAKRKIVTDYKHVRFGNSSLEILAIGKDKHQFIAGYSGKQDLR